MPTLYGSCRACLQGHISEAQAVLGLIILLPYMPPAHAGPMQTHHRQDHSKTTSVCDRWHIFLSNKKRQAWHLLTSAAVGSVSCRACCWQWEMLRPNTNPARHHHPYTPGHCCLSQGKAGRFLRARCGSLAWQSVVKGCLVHPTCIHTYAHKQACRHSLHDLCLVQASGGLTMKRTYTTAVSRDMTAVTLSSPITKHKCITFSRTTGTPKATQPGLHSRCTAQ